MRWIVVIALLSAASAAQTATATVTFYSPVSRGGFAAKLPGRGAMARQGWFGDVWIDHRREIMRMAPGKFVTLQLPEGDHSLAGERAVNGVRFGASHESDLQIGFSFRPGERYFVRLTLISRQVAGFGPIHFAAETVECGQANLEAATSEPLPLKRLRAPSAAVRESYFPQCPVTPLPSR